MQYGKSGKTSYRSFARARVPSPGLGLRVVPTAALLLLLLLLGAAGCGRTTLVGTCPPGSDQCECDENGTCTWCGNGLCDGKEDCTSCASDCGKCQATCGDGTCDTTAGESCTSCASDCGKCPVTCGDGTCDATIGESCTSCPADCGTCPATCGDGICDMAKGESCASCPGDCGTCPATCGDGTCDAKSGETCQNCGKDCGACCGNGTCDTVFGETCLSCSKDCGTCPATCGDGTCDGTAGESCQTCGKDCGVCCGNGTCDAIFGETCSTCPKDCGVCPATCGNGTCDAGETCQSCSKDCGACCGNGTCDLSLGETCSTCPKDCGACPATCGDGKCTGTETCQSCAKDCGSCCGNGTCEKNYGESCTTCPKDCGTCPPVCGDGKCNGTETCLSCSSDCGSCCGNGTCEAAYGETCNTCSKDCGACCGNGTCEAAYGETCNTCSSDCGVCCGNGSCDTLFGEDCKTCPKDCGTCPPSCGDGKCEKGETCQNCANDCGKCCGNGTCEATYGETCFTCASDCGACCGNGSCESAYGETCSTCASDCGVCCGNGTCDTTYGETCQSCAKDCGKCCGNGTCESQYGEDCVLCYFDCGACCGNGVCDSKYGEDCLGCPKDCVCGIGSVCSAGLCLSACPGGAPHCPSGSSTCCQSGQYCMTMGCVSPGKTCKDNYDCNLNEFCDPLLKVCLPLPAGPRCKVLPSQITFKAVEEWSWKGWSKDTGFSNVWVTPIVADLDADQTPEVIFAAYKGASTGNNMLVVLDGATGKEELTIPYTTLNINTASGMAVGNLDSDKELEIVVPALTKGLTVLEHNGTIKWSVASGNLAKLAANTWHMQPSIADLDADKSPEIIVGGIVVDATGKVLFDKGAIGANATSWVVSTVADLDEDGKGEVVGGNQAYRADGSLFFQNTAIKDGFPAVADMNLDGLADIVNVSSGAVRVVTGTKVGSNPAGTVIFGPVSIPGGGSGGPPTVGDFDGDKHPEFAAAGSGYYTVYDLDCTASGTPTTCASARKDGILWSIKTQDISSNVTGSSLFDFEGDGTVEVVYNDECFLRVYDGLTGKVLMELDNTSRTAMEYPLVADVDGDNNSEFVVHANNDQIVRDKCKAPGTSGLRVFGDSADRWVRSRPIWNQHTYHITNIEDNGTIPAPADRNWDKTGQNNFRQNNQGEGLFLAPDLKAVSLTSTQAYCPLLIELRAQVSNVGSLGVAAGIPVSFYMGASLSTAKLIKTVLTPQPMLPGQIQMLSVFFAMPSGQSGPFDFWVVVDDDGTGKGTETECIETNNTYNLKSVSCP